MPNAFEEFVPSKTNAFAEFVENPFAEFVREPVELDASNLPSDMGARQRKSLELRSQMAAEQAAQEERDRRSRLIAPVQDLAEGALTALSLSPSAIAAQFERGLPAIPAAIRGDESFKPLPPVVSSALNPGENRAIKIPKIPTTAETPLAGQIAAGVGNAVIDFANIFTTPEGIASLGIGALPKAAQKQVIGTMAANMAAQYPEQFNQAIEAAKAGDYTTATEKIVSTPVMASVMGRASVDMPRVPRAPEFPGLPDPDLVARNLAQPGTARPQEIRSFGAPRIDPEVYQFEAGNVPFERMQRMGGVPLPPVEILPRMGRIENVPILEETRPKEQLETRGKVSFGAEAPTLLRTAVEQAETVGLTKSAEAAKNASQRTRANPEVLKSVSDVSAPKFKQDLASMSDQDIKSWWDGLGPTGQRNVIASGAMDVVAPAIDRAKAAKKVSESKAPEPTKAVEPVEAAPEPTAEAPKPEPPKRKTLKELRDELENGSRGGERGAIDPSILEDIAAHGRTILKKGMEFADWSAEMIRQFGESIVEHLRPVWDQINKKPERGLPESATVSDLMADMTSAGRKAFTDAKSKPDEFTSVDVTELSPADRRNLARLGISITTDRNNRLQATYPARLRADDLRKAVQQKRASESVPTTAAESRTSAATMTPEAITAEMAALEKQIADLPKPTSPEGVMSYLEEKTKLAQRRSFLQEAQGIQAEKGIISGSKAEAWADDVLRGGGTHAGPDVIAAYAIKGAAIIERGVRDFAKWSEEMMNKYGPEIKDSLKQIYDQSVALIDREKSGEPAVEGEGKMRKSAARATNAEMIPPPVQERIAGAPESRYQPQSMDRVESRVGSMADAELGTVGKETDIYTAAKLEQARRLFEAGNNEAGYQVFVELEKEGTRLGQLINQFKLLNGTTPEQVAGVINTGLKKAGRDGLTPKQTVEAIKIAKDAKAKDADLNAATEAWKKDPTPENAAKAEKALDESNKAALELQKFTAKYTPRTTSSILKSVLQGNLLTPISETANLVGNMSFLPFRAGTRGIATGLDIIDSYLTGRPREISVGPVSGTVEAAKGAVRGAKQISGILAKGTGDVIKGETRTGLHPMRAWVDQFSKNPERPTTGGKLKLQDRVNLLIEGTFGVPAEVMLRGLGAGDAPFKEAARGRVIAEQLRLKNVPKERWAFAQKFPELFFDKETVEQIGRDTAAAVFQRESKTLSLLTRWLSGKGDVLDFAAATVAPYKLTPWNIIGEVLSYNPLVALGKTLYEAKQGNRKAAKINAGKMLIGSVMAASSAWLYQKGLIAPSLDERDEAQKARVLSGQVLPPNHINVSGLKRALEGGDPSFQPGDETRDFFRSGGLAGSMLYMTANVGRDLEKKPDNADKAMSILRQSTLEQARFGINQSFLQGVEGLLTAIKEGNPDNYLRQWFSTVLSIPLPNSMATLSRATREYKPDFREEDFKNQIGNVIKNRVGFAGYDDYLPLKRDFWGKPIPETPKDRNALFYHFFDVTKGQQVTDDPVSLELYRLWRKTADSKVIPSLVSKEITIGNKTSTLNAEQQSRLAELVGEERRRIVDAMVINPNFHKLSDEGKIKLLERIYDIGLNGSKEEGIVGGKNKFLRENPDLQPKPPKAGFKP